MKFKKEQNHRDDLELISLNSMMKWIFTVKHHLLRINISVNHAERALSSYQKILTILIILIF